MHRAPLLLCLTACGFHSSQQPAIDAAPPIDGKPTSDGTCEVGAASATGTDRGKVGLSTGGGNRRPLACDGGTRLVGLALAMSDGVVNGGTSRSAQGIQFGCASVTVDKAGGHTGPITMKDLVGNGGAGFTPATMTALAVCPPGSVVSGLQVHGSSYVNLFLDATVTCSVFDIEGELTGKIPIAILGSLIDPLNPSQAACNDGEQVVSMATDMGAGLDSVRLLCAATTCD